MIAAGRGGPEALAAEDRRWIYSWTGLRQPIPLEFWPDLRFDFEANKASNDTFSYSHVNIDQDGAAGPQGDTSPGSSRG